MNDLSNILRPKTLNEFIGQKHNYRQKFCSIQTNQKKRDSSISFLLVNPEQEKPL